jgi:two-component system, LytTR family, sensor kinase
LKNFTFNNSKKLLQVYTIWWIVWSFVQAIILHRLGLSWSISFQDANISSLLMGLSAFTAVNLYKYYQPGRNNRIYRFLFALGITLLFCSVFNWVLKLLFSTDQEYLKFLAASMPIRFVFFFLMLSFITLLNWLWNNLQEQKEQEKRSNDAEQLMKDAELAKLRLQLKPHFLFNSLNSISALAGNKPNEARKMIQQLSDFLRGTLKKDEAAFVPLNDELEHLRLYLGIEKVRFGHRLRVEIITTNESLLANLPPLVLQPIVENAIKFGLYDTIGDITITITTQLENAYLFVEVKNPFDQKTQNTNQGTGFGLNSIQRRLFLLYTRTDLLQTEKQENIFITKLKIPQAK